MTLVIASCGMLLAGFIAGHAIGLHRRSTAANPGKLSLEVRIMSGPDDGKKEPMDFSMNSSEFIAELERLTRYRNFGSVVAFGFDPVPHVIIKRNAFLEFVCDPKKAQEMAAKYGQQNRSGGRSAGPSER